MATKTFYLEWMGQYKASTNSYNGGGSPIRVGSSANYQSYLGFPSAVRDALKTSKTATTMKIKLYVTDGAEFDFGGHKETYNKAGGTMPWYKYIGLHPVLGTGWQTVDLTSAFMNDYKAGTYHGVVLYGTTSNLGVASNTGSTRVVIEVNGSWNTPPNAPLITYPSGGEIVDKSVTLRWSSGGDPDGDSLKYQIAYKEGDGGTWKYITTGYGVTSYTFDTSGWTEGSNAQFGVRASDGEEWGAYDYTEKFTINHNRPPAQPTQLSPANGAVVDRTEVLTFRWKHNDDGAQAGYRIAWRTVSDSGVVGEWNYIPNGLSFVNSTSQYYNMPANTLPNATIEWGVQTKDQQGFESLYSNYVRIQSREPTNAPQILSPSYSSEISTTRVTVEWSSLNQQEYELILYDTNGLELFSEIKAGSIKLKEIPIDLDNNKWYEVHLRVKDSTNQIWSDYSVVTFGTNFTPPVTPTIFFSEQAGEGIANIFYSAGDTSTATRIDLYRREYTPQDTEPWLKIAESKTLDGSFLDYTPASTVEYEYKVKAVNETNHTSSDSFTVSVRLDFFETFLQEASNLSSIVLMKNATSRDSNIKIDSALMQFAGRRDPVREFGENEEMTISVEWEVDTYSEVRLIRDMLKRRDILLYRDGYGRRYWVTADGLSISDKVVRGFVLSTTLIVTSYDEDLNKPTEEELI